MSVYDKIKKLCDENHIAVTALEKELGFGRGSIGKMRYGTRPNAERLKKIADYFGIPLEELMEEEPPKKTVIKVWHSSNPQRFAEDFAEKVTNTYHESLNALMEALPKLTEDEEILVSYYESLNDENKKKLLRYASALLDTQQADEILEKVEEKDETNLDA